MNTAQRGALRRLVRRANTREGFEALVCYVEAYAVRAQPANPAPLASWAGQHAIPQSPEAAPSLWTRVLRLFR